MKMDVQPVLNASRYDRAKCRAGIVHLGYGAFHRAHQAWYFDQYMEKTGDLNWGIVAVNLRSNDASGFATATKRDDGYVLKTISPVGETKFELVRSHIRFEDWSSGDANQAELIADPSVKIVSMTVTESGYCLNSGGSLDLSSSGIASELADGRLETIYGFLRAGLNARKAAGDNPVTLLCCDNIRHNGLMLQKNLRRYLEAFGDNSLIEWIDRNVTFPCSMVDRITPKPTSDLNREIAQLFRRENDASVMGEDFIQWVVEENFAASFPKLGEVGVTITDDVTPYEETKIRVLNGGHTCLVYLGALKGHAYYHDQLEDPELLEHYSKYEKDEVLPALPENLPFDKTQYYETVTSRFRNAEIADSVERICMDGYNKFPIFILPTIRKCIEMGLVPIYGIRSIASWYVFARNIVSGSLSFTYYEPYMDQLRPLLVNGGIEKFIHSSDLWGDLPMKFPQFAEYLKSEIQSLEARWPA